MPNPRNKQQLSLLRRIPMPLMSVLIGLLCGLIVWAVLDRVQPQALRQIFAEELQTRLEQQARETLARFENYVAAQISTARLLANHQYLASYLEPIYWFNTKVVNPIVYDKTPPWLPSNALLETLVKPSHVLLFDLHGQIREIYQVGTHGLPPQLASANEFFLGENREQAKLTALDGAPYLLVRERADDVTGNVMGNLMMVTPIDSRFLNASQAGSLSSGVMVGLLDGDDQRFLASSDPEKVPAGTHIDKTREKFLVTDQSFFHYEGSTLNLLFATLVPQKELTATRKQVASLERRQRIVTALSFVAAFTLVFYLFSERLKRTLHRLSLFSSRALGVQQPIIDRGNQLLILEDWIRQFIQQVRETRDEMRLQHESAIQESEALKWAIMESSLDSIISVDQNVQIIEFNTTAEQVFGYRREEVLGKDFVELILRSEGQAHFYGMMERCLERESKSELRYETTAIRADGSRFPVEVSIKPISLQSQVVFTVYIHNISQRKRAEKQIRSMAKFASESPSPVLRVNRPGVIIYANAASRPLLNYWGCGHAQTLPHFWRHRVSEVFELGADWETEVTCGDHVYSLLLTPIVELEYVNIYGRDITAVRQAERQAREHQQELVHVSRLSTMGEMATGLAHELNQPLSAIANYANGTIRRLQLSGKGSDDIYYALGQINSQANRAGEIIKHLRSLVAKQPPVRKVADLNVLVREVCSFVEFDARKSGVWIEQELSLSPLMTRIDVVQIEQVLLNLLRNALDALEEVPEEERSLVMRTGALDDRGVCVEVMDSGSGISGEVAEKLFEPFYTTKESGMGMGLVISRTIIEDHKGEIRAEPREGGGSRFTVVLPLAGSDDEK